MNRLFDLELRVPSTNRIPFRAHAELTYRKNQYLKANLEIENKILKDSHFLLNYQRERKSDSDVVPHVVFEALLDSKIRNEKHYRLFFDIEPSGKDIKSDLIYERSNPSTNHELVKVIDSMITLTSIGEQGIDYSVDLQVDTARPSRLHIFGQMSANMFQSNIDLQAEYKGPSFELTTPVGIKIGHHADLSAGAKSHVEIGFKAPYPSRPIDHHLKVIFFFNYRFFWILNVRFF